MGFVFLAIGVGIALITIAAGVPRFGRAGLLLGIAGLCVLTVRSDFRLTLFALWAVPVPNFLIALGSPELEMFWGRLSAACLTTLGLSLDVAQKTISAAAHTVRLESSDGGLLMVWVMAGYGWHRGLRKQGNLGATIKQSLLWATFGIPVQALLILIGSLGLAAGLSAASVRAGLDHGAILVLAGLLASDLIRLGTQRVVRDS